MSGLFDHCCQGQGHDSTNEEERWRTLYLVAGMCDSGDQLAAACAEARHVFPDWPKAWTAQDPSVYDIFSHIADVTTASPANDSPTGYEPWDAWGAHPRGLVDWGTVQLVSRAHPVL